MQAILYSIVCAIICSEISCEGIIHKMNKKKPDRICGGKQWINVCMLAIQYIHIHYSHMLALT